MIYLSMIYLSMIYLTNSEALPTCEAGHGVGGGACGGGSIGLGRAIEREPGLPRLRTRLGVGNQEAQTTDRVGTTQLAQRGQGLYIHIDTYKQTQQTNE